MKGIIFFDRDWVLNKKAAEHQYISNIEDFVWNKWAKELIKFCSDLWFTVLIITNQQWIGKWLFTIKDVDVIHNKIKSDIAQFWGKVSWFYICPHLASINCNCRKPKTWMLEQACIDYDFFDKTKMFLIGDSKSDIEAANKYWINNYKVESDKITDNIEDIKLLISKI